MWNKPIVQVLMILVVLLAIVAAYFQFSAQGWWGGLEEEEGPDNARAVIREQLYLLQQGDVELLGQTFTERLRSEVTAELVTKAMPIFRPVSVDALVGDVVDVADAPVPTRRVTTPEGRLLTSLVKPADRWLADTLWIR